MSSNERSSQTVPGPLKWMVVAAFALAGTIVGSVFASSQSTTYLAEAELTVGGSRVNINELPGYVTASVGLASIYSRYIYATDVVNFVSGQTGVTAATYTISVEASPVPDAPVIRIRATSDSAAKAIELANSASVGLKTYVQALEGDGPARLAKTKEDFQALAKSLDSAVAAQEIAIARFERERSLELPDEASLKRFSDRRAEAASKAELLKTETEALKDLYIQQTRAVSNGFGIYELRSADSATSDAQRQLQTMAVLGATISAGLSILYMNLKRRPKP